MLAYSSNRGWLAQSSSLQVAWYDAVAKQKPGKAWAVALIVRDFSRCSSQTLDRKPAHTLPPFHMMSLSSGLCSFWRKAVATALSPASIEGCVPRLAHIIQSSVDSWVERGSTSLMHEVRQGLHGQALSACEHDQQQQQQVGGGVSVTPHYRSDDKQGCCRRCSASHCVFVATQRTCIRSARHSTAIATARLIDIGPMHRVSNC
jgi:hypothetical protein